MKTIHEYAVEYCGDPSSHTTRGNIIFDEMIALGMKKESKVLNIGCGTLSEGRNLIYYLDEGNYTGLDPNGWLIRAALDFEPQLEVKKPNFEFGVDFMAARGPYDFIVSHSVLSHVAHWQMELALANVRNIVDEGAVWLASLRFDQYDLFAEDWVYPGNSYFRRETVQAIAYYFGWHTTFRDDFKKRVSDECPNDIHDWVVLTAVPSSAELNDRRIDVENARREENERIAAEAVEKRRMEMSHLAELESNTP